MIYLHEPLTNNLEKKYISDCLKSNTLAFGKYITLFENKTLGGYFFSQKSSYSSLWLKNDHKSSTIITNFNASQTAFFISLPVSSKWWDKGTTIITEEDVSSKDKVRCKDRTGKIWFLSYHQIERVKGE